MSEIWKVIPSFPDYEASSLGRIRNAGSDPRLRHRIKEVMVSDKGYHSIKLSVEGRGRRRNVSRLVCEAFHGPAPTERHQAAHNDGNNARNVPENLEWKTPVENHADKVIHGTVRSGEKNSKAKLTDERVAEMRRAVTSKTETIRSLAKRFEIAERTAKNAIYGQTWKHVAEPPAADPRPRTLANTSCLRGHDYTPENTRHKPDGSRVCLACRAAAARRRRAAPTETTIAA